MKTKVCTTCRVEKELSEFHKSKKGKYGVNSRCKVCIKKYDKERNKEYLQRPEVKKRQKEYQKEYSQKPAVREHRRKSRKEWYHRPEVKEHRCKYQSEYRKQRYNSDLNYKIRVNLRSRILAALNGNSKSASTLELIGCTIEFLKEYLESQFQEGMSWDNYSFDVWHIDHIRPCSSFDLKDPEQQKQCFHYTNLQPLWAFENMSKGAKYEQ